MGTVVASFLGTVDFTAVRDALIFHMVKPFYFGMPTFEWSAMVESTGVYFALGDICEREVKIEDLEKGYRAEGIAVLMGGIFNAFPYTTFSQNVGCQIPKNHFNYWFDANCTRICTKIAAVTTIIPAAVLGGAMVAMFGMGVSQGIKMLSKIITDSQENSMITACSIGIGLGVTVVPDLFAQLSSSFKILTSNGIVAGNVTAIALNIVFNMIPSKNKLIE